MSVASTPAQWGVLMVIKHRMFKQKMNDQVQNLELLGRKKLRKLEPWLELPFRGHMGKRLAITN